MLKDSLRVWSWCTFKISFFYKAFWNYCNLTLVLSMTH